MNIVRQLDDYAAHWVLKKGVPDGGQAERSGYRYPVPSPAPPPSPAPVPSYKGTAYFRDGTKVAARFDHHRWPRSKETDLDFELFDIVVEPGARLNQPYRLSLGGYYDRDKKVFMLRELALTINNTPGFRNEQIVFYPSPMATVIPMKQ